MSWPSDGLPRFVVAEPYFVSLDIPKLVGGGSEAVGDVLDRAYCHRVYRRFALACGSPQKVIVEVGRLAREHTDVLNREEEARAEARRPCQPMRGSANCVV